VKLREVAGAVATQRRSGALPYRDPLQASPDAVASDPNTEDGQAAFEELVVSKQGVAAVLCCSEQRASSERALGVARVGCPANELLEGKGKRAKDRVSTTSSVTTAPPERRATLVQNLNMILASLQSP